MNAGTALRLLVLLVTKTETVGDFTVSLVSTTVIIFKALICPVQTTHS